MVGAVATGKAALTFHTTGFCYVYLPCIRITHLAIILLDVLVIQISHVEGETRSETRESQTGGY